MPRIFSGWRKPHFARGQRGEADLLVHELLVPRLADAEGVHVANLHVGHHLRRRNDDKVDVFVRIDATCRQPVAHPEIVRAAGKGHRDARRLSGRLLGREPLLERTGVQLDPSVGIFLRDRDALAVFVQIEERVHRQRLLVLHHRTGGIEMRLRPQDVAAVNAAALAAEGHVIARRAP